MGKYNIGTSEDSNTFEPTRYWVIMTDEEKARATSKKIVHRFLLIRKLLNELLEQVSATRAIDILLEECEREGFMDRNAMNKAIYGMRKKV